MKNNRAVKLFLTLLLWWAGIWLLGKKMPLEVLGFINNLRFDYNWFFSTLSQSLAALIGISGLFIVYRLQIQENVINSAVASLQRQMSPATPELLLHLSQTETLKMAEDKIKEQESYISNAEGVIKTLKERQIGQGVAIATHFANGISRQLTNISDYTITIKSLKSRKDVITTRLAWKNSIQWAAFISIVSMTFVFFLSLLGLLFNDYFLKNPNIGNWQVIRLLILLLGVLFQLILCCAFSLNLGRPAFKDGLKELFNF